MSNIISIQSLNAMFSFLNERKDSILWITNLDMDKQVYISPSVESIFKTTPDVFYKQSSPIKDFIIDDDLNRSKQELHDDRVSGQHSESFVRIINKEGELVHLKDTSYLLCDAEGKNVGISGICEIITEQEWEEFFMLKNLKINTADQKKLLKQHVFNVLQTELKVSLKPQELLRNDNSLKTLQQKTVLFEGKALQLTARELEVLFHLMQGKSAKQTAAILFVSTRTIEFHLNNIKIKAQCRTKLELLSKITIV